MSDIVSILASQTGVCHTPIRRAYDAGKKTPETKKAEEERNLEEIKKVQPIQQIYNSKGKNIRHVVMGGYVNIEA
jgi:hypothetical protein